MNTFHLSHIFSKGKFEYLFKEFSDITTNNFACYDKMNQLIYQTIEHLDTEYYIKLPICVNGETVGYMKGPKTDTYQKKSTEFLKNTVELLLNKEFTTADLVKTTANFWKELNFIHSIMYDVVTIFDTKKICESLIQKTAKVITADNAQLIIFSENETFEIGTSIGYEQIHRLAEWSFKNDTSLLINEFESLPGEIKESDNQQLLDIIFNNLPLIIVPIKSRGEILGVLLICRNKNQQMFSADDLKLLNSIGYQIGLAIHNVNMINKLRITEKIEKEMELASGIQKEFLPKAVPKISDLEIAGRCISANAVGGDYYDFFEGKDLCNFVLADVSGHGVSAALVMSTVRSSLRGLFSQDLPLEEVAYRLNNFIVSDSGTSGMFVTLFYLRYFINDNRIDFINSGQTPPILIKGLDRSICRLETGGSPAGFFENITYTLKSQPFEDGDLLVIYTDGFIEAINQENKRFGEERFAEIIRDNYELSAEMLINTIYSILYEYTKGLAQNDDMTILVIKKKKNVC